MEVAHRDLKNCGVGNRVCCFNPCSNGSCSPSYNCVGGNVECNGVLILVLMEVAHRGKTDMILRGHTPRFNPCSNGSCSPRQAANCANCLPLSF